MSARIIAAGIVIAFCYWASEILVTLLVAVLLAYFLDPLVTWMESIHIPRALGSLLIVLVTIAGMMVLAWTLIERVDQFGADWPKYRAPLRAAANAVQNGFRQSVRISLGPRAAQKGGKLQFLFPVD